MGAKLACMAYTILAALLVVILIHSSSVRHSSSGGEDWCPGCQDSAGNVGARESFIELAILGWVLQAD